MHHQTKRACTKRDALKALQVTIVARGGDLGHVARVLSTNPGWLDEPLTEQTGRNALYTACGYSTLPPPPPPRAAHLPPCHSTQATILVPNSNLILPPTRSLPLKVRPQGDNTVVVGQGGRS
jgi:hypothetical protein